MGDGWVVFCYTVTYGMIAWYAVWLMTRYRGLRRRLQQFDSDLSPPPE